MLKKIIGTFLLSLGIFLTTESKAQNSLTTEQIQLMNKMEDSLILVADSMYNAFIPDERINYCEQFIKRLIRILKQPNSYVYEFTKLKEKVNIIQSDDKAFKLFNWYILPDGVRPRYYGAVQKSGTNLKLTPLFDRSYDLNNNFADSVLSNERWFGALYYKILMNEIDGDKIYTLFGLNANKLISNRKVLEPMQLTEKGVSFGAPIFNTKGSLNGRDKIKRYILEYKKDVNVSLNWDNELKMIVLDRLVSQVNDTNRKYTFAPSGQYDGFKWENDRWRFVTDIIQFQNLKDGEAPAPKPLNNKK